MRGKAERKRKMRRRCGKDLKKEQRKIGRNERRKKSYPALTEPASRGRFFFECMKFRKVTQGREMKKKEWRRRSRERRGGVRQRTNGKPFEPKFRLLDDFKRWGVGKLKEENEMWARAYMDMGRGFTIRPCSGVLKRVWVVSRRKSIFCYNDLNPSKNVHIVVFPINIRKSEIFQTHNTVPT